MPTIIPTTSASTGGTLTWTYDQQRMETWYQWVGTSSTTGSFTISDYEITQNQLWGAWMRDGGQEWHRPPQITPEEVQTRHDLFQRQREAESRRRLQAEQARRQDRIQARERAEELLLMLLTPEQRIEFDQREAVTVVGSAGGRYRIEMHRGSVHGNIVELDSHGCHRARLCVAPGMYDRSEDGRSGALPTADGWIGQLLAIQHNEEELKAKANYSSRRACTRQQLQAIAA